MLFRTLHGVTSSCVCKPSAIIPSHPEPWSFACRFVFANAAFIRFSLKIPAVPPKAPLSRVSVRAVMSASPRGTILVLNVGGGNAYMQVFHQPCAVDFHDVVFGGCGSRWKWRQKKDGSSKSSNGTGAIKIDRYFLSPRSHNNHVPHQAFLALSIHSSLITSHTQMDWKLHLPTSYISYMYCMASD